MRMFAGHVALGAFNPRAFLRDTGSQVRAQGRAVIGLGHEDTPPHFSPPMLRPPPGEGLARAALSLSCSPGRSGCDLRSFAPRHASTWLPRDATGAGREQAAQEGP